MSRLLICTVGTSLLTNRDQRPWAGWQRQQPLPDADAVDRWLSDADAVQASAETNTLHAVGLQESDRVLLLHSDTSEGRFCSQRLEVYLRPRCHAADSRPLTALGYHSPSFAQRGLKSLVCEAITAVAQAHRDGLQPVFCATGGFKAETAFLNLLGALLYVEVCYIHEHFREVVRLPRLPLTWDAEFVERHRDFFEWIDAEPRASVEVEGWLRGRPELRPLVEDGSDGNTYLNAAGDLLFRAARERLAHGPRAVWPEAVPRTPEEKNGLSGVEHHRPRGWERFVARLCAIDCVSRVSYDAAASSGPEVRILDASTGTLAVRCGRPDTILPLRVETSAHGEAQTELVAEYLRRLVRG
jgi:putative CRISPR-associated protein (TIGR02619 family)